MRRNSKRQLKFVCDLSTEMFSIVKAKEKSNIYICDEIFFHFCFLVTQVGFAEFNNTADNRANIGGTIIGAPIVGQ